MALTLYAPAGDFRAFKAQIAAQYNGVTLNKPAFDVAKDAATAEFKAKSPAGRVPVLETPSGCIFESNAIARYIARIRRDTELTGRTFFESAQVDSWMDFVATEVELPATLWVYPILGLLEARGDVTKKAQEDLHRALATLERHLLLRTYLVGEAVTLADITAACALLYPFKLVLDAKAREAYPSVTRWFVTCVNQAAFKAVVGDVVLATEVMAAGKGGAAAPAKKEEKPKADKPKAEEKPKAEGAKKEEKPKKKKDEDDDGGDDDMAALLKEEKKPDPFAALPPTPLVLDEWKRTYSNSKTDYYAVMPWFWEHLDAAGWSIWFQKYKYNDENKVDWQTSNLIGGFLQRCDEVRKYAFGAMAVLGDKAPFEVQGVWMLRGGDIKPLLDCNPDAEYYEWTKMDPANEAQRALVADTWCALEKLEGKPIYDSKVFK